jgi:Protein of unknown function (DUF1583)
MTATLHLPSAKCAIRFALLIIACIFNISSAVAFQAQDEAPKEFYHDFRGRPLPPELTWFHIDNDKTLQVEPEGVRIKIPKTWIHPWGGVGLKTAFGLKGNFEVTTAYEIIEAETPPDGFGVGVCLFVGTGDRKGASAARLVKANGNQVALWDITQDPQSLSGVVPCADKIGRLRLTRMGTVLYYLMAPGLESNDFKIFHQHEFGNADIEYVRLGALNGRTQSNVDVRLLDLRIRDQMKAAPIDAAPLKSFRGWLAAAVVIFLIVAASLALGLWFFVRRRRSAEAVIGKDEP